MRSRLVPAIVGVLVTTLVVLSPAIYRTLAAFGSAGTLFQVAASESGCPTAVPRDFNCYLISPEIAVRIVETFDTPTVTEDTSPYFPFAFVPLLHATISESTPPGDHYDPELNARMLRLLTAYLGRGLSIERRMSGVTPLQYAVALGQYDAAALLLERGADPFALVDRPGRPSHDMNAQQLAQLRSSRDSEYDQRLTALLEGGAVSD